MTPRPSPALWSCVAALACAAAVADEPRSPTDFLRVHVPPGRLQDVPLGSVRYVPMSAAEFEAAVDRLGPTGAAAAGPRPLAARSRYELAVDESGRLAGRVTFDLAATDGAFREIDLGAVRPGRCTLRTAAGTGEAVVFGRPDGTVAVRGVEAGTYECELSVPPSRPGAAVFTVPLVPALATVIVVRPPPGLRPVVAGDPAGRALVRGDAAGDWLIEFGPAADAVIAFGAEDAAPLVTAWTDTVVLGGRVEAATMLAPRSAWAEGELVVEKPPELRLVAVELAATGRPLDWTDAADRRSAAIGLPREVAGGREPVVVRGVSACGDAAPWQVPLVRPPATHWGGGGARIEVDPAVGVIATATKNFIPVTPEVAVRWPLPTGERRGVDAVTGDALRPAILHFEQQAADASLALTLRPRQPQLDVARVTTVELSPGQVVGRAACDVRVVTGEAFAIAGRIAPGWIIDAVELVEPFDRDTGADGQPPVAGKEVDWRISRGRDGGPELRVGLAVAATPRRSLGLRVTGHRGGVPLGEGFRTADMDMVRFDGEAADTAVIDFNVGPEAVVEVGGAPLGVFAVPPRLARLVEPGTLRGRLPGGMRAPDREARLVQRRPPLDARVAIELAVRDERLAESFTLTCRPEAAAVDSIVVHFSEPMGDGLAWSLLAPGGGSLVARRLDAADTARGEGRRTPGCAESWLVEITPAFTDEVTVRAARDVAFLEPRRVPLAWVEGATNSDGTVLVRDTGPARPAVRNRRLRELPPDATDAPRAALVEFAFSAARVGEDPEAAAELLPAAGADGRAWTWLETLTCRCHESGRTECEATFDIENHGRDSVSLSVLPGRVVEGVLIDGSPVRIDALDGGSAARVPLPPQARTVRLVVRTLAAGDPRAGCWRIDPVGCTIDVPALEQRLDVLLPPGLEIGAVFGGYRAVDGHGAGLVGRLLAARPAGEAARLAAPRAAGSAADGFRPRRFVPTGGPEPAGAFLVVRRSLVSAAALIGGLLGFLGMLATLRRSAAAAILLAAAAAAAAVWLAPPLESVARSVWWGVVGAAACRGLAAAGAVRATAAGWLLLAACGGTAAGQPVGAAEPLKVFLTPGEEGGMALVPEPLYRALVREAGPAAASVRVVRCVVLVEEGAVTAAWRLRLDVDADAGGSLTLDQGPGGGRWEPVAAGESRVQLQDDGRLLRLVTPTSGSQRIELRVLPAVERAGCLETAAIRLPPAALSRLDVVDAAGATVPADAGAFQCDRAAAGGPFVPTSGAASGEARFDLCGAERVRLVRPLDRRHRLAAGGLTATSENDLVWDLAGCRVRARFEVAGDAVVRAVVVAADPALEPFGGVPAGQVSHPLGGGRHLLERTAPEPGPATFGLELRLPLSDPVGTFPVPRAWIDGLEADARTVRLSAAPDFVATLDPPLGQPAETRSETGPAGEVRRYDAGRASLADGPVRLAVSRRRQEIRGSQALTVTLEDDFVGLRLRGRIDATARPLLEVPVEVPPGCEFDRVTLREDDPAGADVALRPPLDVQWSIAGNRMTIVVQQPRAGRYRLDVEGRLRLRPAARGRLPLVRADLAGDAPLVVSWSRRGQPPITTVEVPAGAAAPDYRFEDEPPAAAPPVDVTPARPAATAVRAADRIEQALVTLSIDDRGRLRGVARFDFVTGRQAVRLRLPTRMRLFDALIDGRQANVQPETADTWDVQLHAADWPRSLMLLFTGELDAAGGTGEAIRLPPPTIEGLPCDTVLWQVEPPPGMRLRVAGPARLLAGSDWERAVAAGRERIRAAFDQVLAGVREPDRARLRAFADMRSAGGAEPREDAWLRAMRTAGGEPVRAAAQGDGGLTVRLVRREDPSAPQRTAATAVLAAVAVWTILAARRRAWIWERLRGRAAAATPWLLVAGGVAWLTTLAPALPGWLLVATGAVAVAVDWKRRHDGRAAHAAAADRGEFASTRSLPAG